MNAATVEWVGAGASAAVAVVAGVGLAVALLDSKSANQRAAAAEKATLTERRRLAMERTAELELQRVQLIATMVGAAVGPHIMFSPLERGQVMVALDALPQDRLALTRTWWEGSAEEVGRVRNVHLHGGRPQAGPGRAASGAGSPDGPCIGRNLKARAARN